VILDPSKVSATDAYRLLITAIVPRPIAFVSTISKDGIYNLAPFSFFNGFCGDPPIVGFSPNNNPPKDSLVNARETGEFVVNIVTEDIAEKMNLTSGRYPPDVDEFQVSKLTPVPSVIVKAPRVLESPINMECKVMQIIDLSTRPEANSLVLGQVVFFHVDDAVLDERGRIDPLKLRALGRLGGTAYCRTTDLLHMTRPQ
jgi:flavin reductase (DIM6/NTAB) family NADH-FMN oxidoreductase RutF